MIFGSEPPLYLKPVGRRGLRRHEADKLQHYPGYTHPLLQLPTSEGYISENHRLHPLITPAAELQHEQQMNEWRRRDALELRRKRHAEREANLVRQREEDFQREQRHKQAIAGLSIRNEPGDGRDTVTRQYRTMDARRLHESKRAVEEQVYFARQRRIAERNNTHGYNIVTGEPLHVFVEPTPPQPSSSSCTLLTLSAGRER